jgi:predicted TIM-barrel fold metal-dependent hydrolase
MKIIDAQVHIWSQTVVPPSGLHRKVSKFTAEEALKEMDEAGVDAALIHPPYSWDPTSNQFAIDAARKYPDRFAVMGQFPLDDPESRKRIHGWRNQPGMMGLRWALLYPDQQKALHEGKLDWVWPAAEKEGIPVATMAGLFPADIRAIAEAHPRLKLIIDHCGPLRLEKDAAASAISMRFCALAKRPTSPSRHRRAGLFHAAPSVQEPA